ncbi:MAG TPA: TIGR03643 family protein [Lacibacter sp.]|nr:TIGR03643 family protein [Lacibacter sp.]HMO87658.1 TIGR03643 family protein [Lacibacter sp.]
MKATHFNPSELDRIIEMAWEDRTPFEAIRFQFGVTEQEVIELMRQQLLPPSFRRWRKRVQGRATKHRALRPESVGRFKCNRQRTISRNKISKR